MWIEILLNVLSMVLIIVFGIAIIFIALAAVVYLVGYLYDCVLGDTLVNVGRFLGSKFPIIKDNIFFQWICVKLQRKELYLRYETPLFAFCFSYMAVYIIAFILPIETGEYILASLIYLICYFIGMARRGWKRSEYYDRVLRNNLEFLKLSFLPLAFIVTLVGFVFTITGLKIQELPWDKFEIFETLNIWMSNSDESSMVNMLIRILILGAIFLFLLYVFSLPLQVVSYFIISVIQYFRAHRKQYVKLLKIYWDIIIHIKELIFR